MTLTRKKPMARKSALRSSGRVRVKNPEKLAKRKQRNREYYASPEWRAKKKAVHERDDYQCVEMVGPLSPLYLGLRVRCPNRGEVVNGKQTARGLVAEEQSYGHRGIPDRIDRIITRCKDCDRRLTPQERINHAQGFRR